MRYRIAGPALAVLAALAMVGCSSTAGGSASAGAAASTPAQASAAPTAAPSEAAPSEAAASEAAPSGAIPSFAFPSTDKELEALLPAELCGAKVQKLSMGGEVFANAADPTFTAVLTKLGKSASDVSFAVAAPLQEGAKCSAGIFRIKGADSGALKAAFLEAAAKDGNTFVVKSIGGKEVYVDPTSTDFGWAYFKDDAVIFASADSDANAEAILAVLP